MELGSYLRKCRENSKRTQPDVAAQIQIEQSYLSKLESGKSIPSEEVFSKLLQVYKIDLEEMLTILSANELDKLKEIKAIQALTSRKKSEQLTITRKWLVAGLIMLMLGGGFLAVALIPDRAQQEFHYRSEGVLKTSEDLNAFDLVYKETLDMGEDNSLKAKRENLLVRLDQKNEISPQYLGDAYVVNTENGRRFFKLVGKEFSPRSYFNRWFLIPAVMSVIGGICCFLIARRWN